MKKKYAYQAKCNIASFCRDEEYAKRRNALKYFSEEFQKRGIKWALAWSTSLFLTGIVDGFHDYDIIVEEMDVDVLKRTLKEIGFEIKNMANDDFFLTKAIFRCLFDGVQFEVIVEFGLALGQVNWKHRFDERNIKRIHIGNLEIPFFCMEIEYLLYAVLEDTWQPHRRFKRLLIEEYLSDVVVHQAVFERAIGGQHLPRWIEAQIGMLLEE